jgi:hypothetical protein
VLIRRIIVATLIGLALCLAPTGPALAAAVFPDVPATHPYFAPITALASTGAIDGFSNGDFRPDDPVNRQQFAKMIVKTMGVTVTGYEVSPFTDVAPASAGASDPFYPDKYVAICYARGWVTPKTDTTFRPFDYLSRAELVAVVARAADLPAPPAAYEPPFGNFSTEYYPVARVAAYAGLLAGLTGTWMGSDFFLRASRAECAQVLYNMPLRVATASTTTTITTASPTSSETVPTTQSGVDTSVGPGSSSETSAPGGSTGGEGGFPTTYLVVGICIAVLIALAAVFLVVRRGRRVAGPGLAPAEAADAPPLGEEFQQEFEALLRTFADVEKTLPALPAGVEDEDLWDELREPSRNAEPGEGPPVGESEG